MKELEEKVKEILNIDDIDDKTINNIKKSNLYLNKIRKEGINQNNINDVNKTIKYLNNVDKDENFQLRVRELNKLIAINYKNEVLEKNKKRKDIREKAKDIMKKLKLMKLDYKTDVQVELYLYIKENVQDNNIKLFRYYNEDVFIKDLKKESIDRRIKIFNENYNEFKEETSDYDLERYYSSKLIMKEKPDELIVKNYLIDSLNKINIIKPQYEKPDYDIYINENGNIEIKLK